MRIIFIDAGLVKGITQSICGTTCTYNEVKSPYTGRIWLDRNIGAERVPVSISDSLGYGGLFQWGRLIDGHQCINWDPIAEYAPIFGTTSTLSTSDTPSNALFITPSSSPFDWRNPQNDNLWQGVSGTNNPCPTGYRLPTLTELDNELVNFDTTDVYGGYTSFLKLPAPGYRSYNDGVLTTTNATSYLWTSTKSTDRMMALFLNNSTYTESSYYRSYGFSVRAIKDE